MWVVHLGRFRRLLRVSAWGRFSGGLGEDRLWLEAPWLLGMLLEIFSWLLTAPEVSPGSLLGSFLETLFGNFQEGSFSHVCMLEVLVRLSHVLCFHVCLLAVCLLQWCSFSVLWCLATRHVQLEHWWGTKE